MASSVADNPKSRGTVTVNGWNECKVNGRSLAILRNEMLRSKRTEPSDMTQSPRSTRTEPVPDAPKLSPAPDVEPQPAPPPAEDTDNHPDGSPHKAVQLVRSAHDTPDPHPDSKKDSMHHVPARTSETGDPSPGEEHSKHVSEQPEKSHPNRDSNGDNTAQPPPSAIDAVTSSPNSAFPTGKAQPEGSKVDVDTSDSQNSSAKHALSSGISNEDKVTDARRSVATLSEPATAKEPSHSADKPEEHLTNPEEEYSRSPGSEKGTGRSSAKDAGHKNIKKRMRSPAKQDAKKRKKKHRSDSPPSGARTPSSRKGEKRSKEGKTADLAAAVDVDMVELDPEAREAAAIAAQAEKEEANSRARRTTRLAAGKIKQVDYKASANPQSTRTYSPGPENEDPDGHYHANEVVEAPKSSRRRAPQNHSGHQLRTSRRLTRQRGSYDRETSSNDELDHSGWRSGGNNSDKKHGTHEDVNEVIGTSRTNGIRNDRKRSRADSRRGRSNHSSDIDRGNSGSRDSPDNGSHDLPDDDEDLNEEEDLEEDEDPENRTNALDLNMQDLKCIGIAIREANSLDPSGIVEVIQEQADWKHDDHKNKVITSYVEKITSAILNLKHLVSSTDENITVPEALAFVATDYLRLKNGPVKTGYARRPTAILNRAQKEEHVRTVLDRNRRKEQRDADEARVSLEREMESRRKSEIDSFYAEAQLSEVMGHVKREEARCLRVQNEISRYEALEGDVKARFDKAKLVHEKLHSERRTLESPSAPKNDQHHAKQNEDEMMADGIEGNGTKRRKLCGGPAAISDDRIIGAMDDESLRQMERAKEMARLQALIAARQAEIEEYQRMCVDARMTFASIADAKSRLETELHVVQSVAFPNYGSSGQTAPAAHYVRSHKESGRKNEHKSGSGGGRNTGNSRSKPHGRGSGTGTPSKPNGSSKSKSGNGRHGDNGNRAKRKASSKHS
ncbi:fimbrial protein type IV pilin PilE [Gracilaria domingensis]|nr:fimbrial protein type IV pilin PilE [Gracilaria domingensis]